MLIWGIDERSSLPRKLIIKAESNREDVDSPTFYRQAQQELGIFIFSCRPIV